MSKSCHEAGRRGGAAKGRSAFVLGENFTCKLSPSAREDNDEDNPRPEERKVGFPGDIVGDMLR